MPKYEVSIPNLGKFEVDSPKELTEDEAYRLAVAEATKSTGGDGELTRQLGLTARAGITGAAGLPLLAGDAFEAKRSCRVFLRHHHKDDLYLEYQYLAIATNNQPHLATIYPYQK